jgi:hypothetical protein
MKLPGGFIYQISLKSTHSSLRRKWNGCKCNLRLQWVLVSFVWPRKLYLLNIIHISTLYHYNRERLDWCIVLLWMSGPLKLAVWQKKDEKHGSMTNSHLISKIIQCNQKFCHNFPSVESVSRLWIIMPRTPIK